jgi:hypothetical protein
LYAGPLYGIGSTNIGNGCDAACATGTGLLEMFESPFVFTCFCVLLIPFFGRFICPLAVAGLGFKYFVTNSLDIFGHPFRKPLRNAFIRLEIFGLHND